MRLSPHEAVEQLLSAYLDDELTQAESQAVRIHIEQCRQCQRTLQELQAVQAATQSLVFPEPPSDRMEAIERAISVRLTRAIGWWVLIASLAAAVAFAIVRFIRSREVFGWVDLIAGGLIAGFVLLLASVIRQRLLELPNDRYRRVKR